MALQCLCPGGPGANNGIKSWHCWECACLAYTKDKAQSLQTLALHKLGMLMHTHIPSTTPGVGFRGIQTHMVNSRLVWHLEDNAVLLLSLFSHSTPILQIRKLNLSEYNCSFYDNGETWWEEHKPLSSPLTQGQSCLVAHA